MLLENFELAKDKDILIQNHSRLEEEFNPGYRLWIVTKECEVSKFPSKKLKVKEILQLYYTVVPIPSTSKESQTYVGISMFHPRIYVEPVSKGAHQISKMLVILK